MGDPVPIPDDQPGDCGAGWSAPCEPPCPGAGVCPEGDAGLSLCWSHCGRYVSIDRGGGKDPRYCIYELTGYTDLIDNCPGLCSYLAVWTFVGLSNNSAHTLTGDRIALEQNFCNVSPLFAEDYKLDDNESMSGIRDGTKNIKIWVKRDLLEP